MTEIVEHILSHREPDSKIFDHDGVESFFCDFPLGLKEWPMAAFSPEISVSYGQAYIEEGKFGFTNALNLSAKFKTKNSQYLISEKITYDGNIEIELNSVVREGQKTRQKENFIYEFIQKHYQLLKNLVNKTEVMPSDAYIKIHAHSGELEGVKTRGGYVWATYGFDFANPGELHVTRKAFQKYAKEHGLEILAKDLELFKYPCHFAAFRTNKKVDGQDVGKAFMMQYDWQGILSAELKKNSELFKYGWLYHKQGKSIAENGLSKSFRTMMKKYNQEQKQFNWLKKVFKAKKAFRR